MSSMMSRRGFLAGTLAVAGAARGAAQAPQTSAIPTPSTRDFSKTEPVPYPDPDIMALDPRFSRYIVCNTSIKRLHIGTSWAEGPAWNGVGRYLVWSDIPNNVQMRWIDDDGRVTTFRNPSGYSNGNTFDYEGRQLSLRARRTPRRPLRAERHRDDDRRQVPGQAAQLAERHRRASRRQHLVHRSVLRHPRQLRRLQGGAGTKEAVYRVDRKSGQIEKVTDEVGAAQRPLLLARLQEAVCRRYGHAARDQGLGRRRQVAAQRQAFAQFDIPGTGTPSAATASAATPTATSGQAPGRACRSLRRPANASA